MKKVLFTATVDSHILQFHIPFLKLFKEHGYEVHVATNGNEEIPFCDVKHVIPFERSPFKLNNLKAIKQLRKIINKEKFEIIHTHTPMGSVVTRLAAKKARKQGTRVIYTAHGFHFYKGAPLLNWILFYPVEKYLSKYTDTLITINNEDYELAKNKFKKCKNIEYVPGVGIDEEKFNFKMTKKEKHELRESLGLKDNDFVMIYPAELNKNKNQIMLINSMVELVKQYPNIHLLLPGKDSYNGYYQRKTKELKLDNNIHFLGFRKDIPRLLKISNLAVSTSKREGLPVNILEAIFTGLPIIALKNRGAKDLINNNLYNYVIINNEKEFIDNCISMYNSNSLKKNFNYKSINVKNEYKLSSIILKMSEIYYRKKKVLHLLSSNNFSGAENVACQIIKMFDYGNSDYEMFYCSPIGSIKKTLNNKGINYIEISRISVKNIAYVVNKYNIDIIHAHDVRASFFSCFTKTNVKIISHIHGNHIYMRKLAIQSILYRVVSKKFSNIIWVTDSAYDNYKYKSSVKEKSSILYNVIDEKEIINKVNEDNNNYNYDVVFLGRLNEAKNPMRMIKIMEKIVERNTNTRCAIIGTGEYQSKIEQFISTRLLDNRIHYLGFKENPYKVLLNSKILLMTSIHEGVPMVVLEALSLGKPVVSTPTDGIKKCINFKCGFLSDDDNKIIEEILKLLNDKAYYNLLSTGAKNNFNIINDIDKYKDSIKKIYDFKR